MCNRQSLVYHAVSGELFDVERKEAALRDLIQPLKLRDPLLVVTREELDRGILSLADARAEAVFHRLNESDWEGLAFLVGAAEHGAQPLDFVVWHGVYTSAGQFPWMPLLARGCQGFPPLGAKLPSLSTDTAKLSHSGFVCVHYGLVSASGCGSRGSRSRKYNTNLRSTPSGNLRK
jgi:hypothetical protein